MHTIKGFLASAFLCLFTNCLAAPPTVSNFTPASAAAGMTVTITGTNFTGASSVSFGGTAALSFIVNSATQITAVVAIGTSGQVAVTTIDGTGTRNGFNYVPTSGIITDFGGYWPATGAVPNPVNPDSSHNLVSFTYNGITYSTGVNNGLLNNHSISYTPATYRALPVAGVAGTNGATSTYLALGKKVDGSANIGYTPAVAAYSIKSVMGDGPNGLDLGTGVTNLPMVAVLTFQIFNINPSTISDNQPDILLTQIAQPVAGNDVYSFVDASGTLVGNTVSQDMTQLPVLGSYNLDLFNLSPATPYNSATAYSLFQANTNREIRLAAFKLSDFGITAGNVGQVKALKITPSGNSDYAFVAYNTDAINLPPNVSTNDALTNTTICAGGVANFAVVASATAGGALSYTWEESIDGGTIYNTISNGGNYSGATSNRLTVVSPSNGYKYRAIVTEAGNINSATSSVFTVVVSSPAAPTGVTVAGGSTVCLSTPLQLTSSVTGGSNLNYQWQSNASGSYVDIPGAVINTYVPPTGQTGVISYRLRVASGSGCPGALTSSSTTVTINGVSSTTPSGNCGSGSLTLSATATSGTLDWYAADAGGSSLFTGSSFSTPVLPSTTIYYVVSSGCSGALRVPVTGSIYPSSVGGSVAGGTSAPPGINSTTLTASAYTGSIIKWQSSTDAFNVLINDIANITTQLTVTNLSQTMQFRTVVQSGTCPSTFSSLASITISSLPIYTGSLKATKEGPAIRIQWKAFNQQNTTRFELEKSTDGILFAKVYSVETYDVNRDGVEYQWIDENPNQGNNLYRVREIFNSGMVELSSVVNLVYWDANKGIVVFPNPLRERVLQLRFNGIPSSKYQLRLINSSGQIVFQSAITHVQGTPVHELNLPFGLGKGLYNAEISGSGQKLATIKVLIP